MRPVALETVRKNELHSSKIKKGSQKAVTLIALVVTIVTLLILAGVTIATLTGENGIITKAKQAKENQEEAELYEKIQLILADAAAQNKIEKVDQEQTKSYIAQKILDEKLQAVIETYEDGFVITYGIYTKKILYLDSSLNEIKTELAVVGNTEDWEYTVNANNSVVLTKYKKEISGHFDIPNIIDGHLVTGLGDDLFSYAGEMTSMKLPEGLITIGARTFQNCSSLQWEVVFPKTLETVGDSAFYGCSKISRKFG